MAVKIRLSRTGKKNAPSYRIVAMDSRRKRDGKFIENLGTYDPLKGSLVHYHNDRVEDWLSKGAIMTETVQRLHRLYKKKAASTGS